MNQTLQNFARQQLKDGLSKLPESNQLIFKRMYSHADLEKPINDVVDAMSPEKLDWAMQQVEASIKKLDPIGDKLRSLPMVGVLNVDNPSDPRHKEWKKL